MTEDRSALTGGEVGDQGITYDACRAEPDPSGVGCLIPGFYPASIVRLSDGTLLTETGQRSGDGGRSWSAPKTLFECEGGPEDGFGNRGILRMPNGELGLYYCGCTLGAALGDASNNWFFRWSSDEGQTWSQPVQMTMPGLTMGLGGVHFTLSSGRICVVTYSQFLTPMELWGGSYGTYRGHRMHTESEGHFPEMEVVRVYYSDDCGRSWKANKSWLMGWRKGAEKWTDSFVEATGCQLRDGSVYLIGRSLIGRMLSTTSRDDGVMFDYAYPTDLMTSDSPGRLIQDPRNGNLIHVWNQISREENRRGFRRCRLSSAVSKDDGNTWEHFKNLYSIRCLAERSYIPPDPVMTPVWGDDEVGELPEDFEMWHYCSAPIVGDEVFLGMCHSVIEIVTNVDGTESAEYKSDVRTRVIPLDWFYEE